MLLSQLMKWIVRCPMCRTYGSLPIRRIAPNRWAHSSADMIILMAGNDMQTEGRAAGCRWKRVFFGEETSDVSFFLLLSLRSLSLSLRCICVLGTSPGRRPNCLTDSQCHIAVYNPQLYMLAYELYSYVLLTDFLW